jgi:hypothetical protein
VHLRRALLLFAIVLGLAAIAASVSRPPEESGDRAERPPPATGREETESPSVSPGNSPAAGPTVELRFDAAREQTRRLETGQPATALVEVDEPGLVEIPDLGLSSPAEPLTPARFELLVSDPGRFEITITPARGDEPEDAGTLAVRAAEE